MRSLIIYSVIAFASATALIACDSGSDAATVDVVAASVATGDMDPMLVASCHAAFRDASERVASAEGDASSCVEDSDCTVAIADTGCTGEIASAVSVDGEEAFLQFVDRIDAHVCGALPAECAPAAIADPADVAVACVASRCTIVE